MNDAKDKLDGPDITKRLRDARDFIGTRMNHPGFSSSELRAERPALMDTLRDGADEIERLRAALETEQLDRVAEHHLVVNIEHWSGLEATNSIGAPAALEKINAECRAHLEGSA